MAPAAANRADKTAIEEAGMLFFDCCLALDLALRTAQDLASDPAARELKPRLEKLARVLEICDDRFTLFTEKLDLTFYAHDGE